MKKIMLLSVLFSLGFCLFAQSGTIRELTGEVSIKPAGASLFTRAAVGDAVAKDTIVSTGFKSSALIAAGSSLIAVRPLTRLTLSEIQSTAGTETLNVNLQTGRVKVDVKPPAGMRTNFRVQSPSATASVRGTSFEFDSVNLIVSEGIVDYQGSSGITMPVNAGDSSSVGQEGKAEDPISVNNASLLPPAPVGVSAAADTGGTASPPVVPVIEPPSGGDLDLGISYQ